MQSRHSRHTRPVRWDNLFDDLSIQFDAGLEEDARRAALDDERLRQSRLTLRERLIALTASWEAGERLALELATGDRLELVPVECGADWIGADLVGPARRFASCIIPLAGIAGLLLTPAQVERSLTPMTERPSALARRLGLPIALRDLARRRLNCEVTTRIGAIHGTMDRVGRDHLDLAVHDADAPRRRDEIRVTRLIPLDDVTLVRIRPA